MTRNIDDLDRSRPVDPEKLAAAEAKLLARQRAFQPRELRAQMDLTQAERMHVGQNRVSQIESVELNPRVSTPCAVMPRPWAGR